MTKITSLAFNRKFERKDNMPDLNRRDKIIPAFTKPAGMCPHCEKLVYISPGQLMTTVNGVYSHKACRKNKKSYN